MRIHETNVPRERQIKAASVVLTKFLDQERREADGRAERCLEIIFPFGCELNIAALYLIAPGRDVSLDRLEFLGRRE